MIRVAILGSRGLPPSYGGFESFVGQLARSVDKSEFELYVSTESSLRSKVYSELNVHRVFFPVSERMRTISEGLYDIAALFWASFSPIDIVLLLGYTAVPFCVIPKIMGKRIIVHPDGLEWKRKKFGKIIRSLLKLHERMSMKLADFIIADSKELQKFYQIEYHRSSHYIAYSGTIVSRREFLSLAEKPSDSYYLVVARIEPENNIDVIIRGFLLSNSRRKLIVVGPLKQSPFVNELKRLAESNPKVVLLGGIYERETLLRLRANCFAYIHGHEVGGTNPSLLEALGCGNITIAKDVPFNREVIEQTGFFFEDENSLSNAISQLELLSEQEIERRRLEAQRIILNRYQEKQITLLYESLFREAIGD